ncbi:MAG: alpha/beta hydrolase [Pseudomonas sp.]|uniref:alpha/beta fold hydrolase n=1 Tax=Pseudomonas sp. TaxID=306 RepID=UPI0027329D89|nr:alpha/beta hydrolase [Pseudomonas sp.]MDP3846888.1 alpha/beta hydrolase [Pseudomonas sp.]
MKPATAVVTAHHHYQVYTEFYACPTARKTILLVNGSLATTAAFAQTIKYLQPQFNVVLYDQPYAGQSKPHNSHQQPLSKEDEAEILLDLIELFGADYLLSFSWGGACALLALAQAPARIEKAIISSFTPRLNAPMLDYLEQGRRYLHNVERENIAQLVNNTLGKYLPSLFKRHNQRHISNLAVHEYRQMHAHIDRLLSHTDHCDTRYLSRIKIPMLFVNGEHDEYTSPADARLFVEHVPDCQFSTLRNTGHFLDMEHKGAWLQAQQALLGFLQSAPSVQQLQRRPQAIHSMAV